MNFILNIDTAIEGASVCLAENGIPLITKLNPSQKDSAAWLHIAVDELMKEKQISFNQLSAIAVSSGPGSYTGLRVGMSAAKGFCYALKIPLININTLFILATVARSKVKSGFLCPMIDARRMEVFTAIYDYNLNTRMEATNLILSEDSYQEYLQQDIITFFGNGSSKFESINTNTNATFAKLTTSAEDMSMISFEMLINRSFEDLAYAEPFYGKDFYSPTAKKIL